MTVLLFGIMINKLTLSLPRTPQYRFAKKSITAVLMKFLYRECIPTFLPAEVAAAPARLKAVNQTSKVILLQDKGNSCHVQKRAWWEFATKTGFANTRCRARFTGSYISACGWSASPLPSPTS